MKRNIKAFAILVGFILILFAFSYSIVNYTYISLTVLLLFVLFYCLITLFIAIREIFTS